MELKGTPIHEGTGAGPLLVLEKPLSFWGGVDPLTGAVSDPRHPRHRELLGGRILVMERTIGSSSSSAIMLELLRGGVAPAGIVVGEADAILVLGILVARELGYPTVPLLRVGKARIARLHEAEGRWGTISAGTLRVESSQPPHGNA